jgi:hypothetical protein
MCRVPAEPDAPTAYARVRDNHALLGYNELYIAKAQTNRRATSVVDDLGREAIPKVAGRSGGISPTWRIRFVPGTGRQRGNAEGHGTEFDNEAMLGPSRWFGQIKRSVDDWRSLL